MDKFHIGEVAIFQDDLNAPPRRWNGHDVLILGPLEKYRLPGINVADAHWPDVHLCRLPNGEEGTVAVCFLRKKPPPKQDVAGIGEWDLCPWRPPVGVNNEKAS